MNKPLLVACLLATASAAAVASAVGVSAGSPVYLFEGSDMLFDFTITVIDSCPGALATDQTYPGSGSANGEAAMLNGTQTIAPMSRFLNRSVCTGGNASPTTSQGLVVGLDGISIFGSLDTFANASCNGDANAACDPTFEPGTGAAYNTTISTPVGLYTFNGWRDVLRVLLAGFLNSNPGSDAAALQARDCASPVRVALANNYGSFFENNCAATSGDGTNPSGCTQIRHIFRPDDFSGTADTLVSILNLPEIVRPETFVTVFPNGVSTTMFQHTGMNPFCNSVRPAFALPGIDGVSPQSATNPQVTCLQGVDATYDPTQNLAAPTCLGQRPTTAPTTGTQTPPPSSVLARETAVYRSTMQDNDPIRRTCFGAANGPVGTLAEDNCSHSGDLGLVLPINDVLEASGNNAARYNAGACTKGKLASATFPEVYDAVTQGKIVCARGLLCPNGDVCTIGGGCLVPADASGNVTCLSNKLTAPATTRSAIGEPLVHPIGPGIAEGRTYNQHLYSQLGTAGIYQNNGFVSTTTPNGLPMTGAFYRIHANHSLNPSSTNPAPITCQEAVITDQIGCLVNASPCSLGIAGRNANRLTTNAGTIKINGQNPLTTCIAGDGNAIPAFTYPMSRKLYLNTLAGFSTLTGTELALAGCETDLAQFTFSSTGPSPAGIVTSAIASAGFIQIPAYYNGGEPFCEDFNENLICGAATNSASCPTAVPPNFLNFPTANSTTCGNGIQEAFEDCDCGTAQTGGAVAPASNVSACQGRVNDGVFCSATCRRTH